MRRVAILFVLVACRPTPVVAPVVATTPAAAAPTPEIPSSTLAEIIAGLVPIDPGSAAIVVESGDAIGVCDGAGFPERLPANDAARIADHPPGSTATIVHTEGNTTVEIVGVGCEAPGDIENAKAHLELREPAPRGAIDPGRPELVGMAFGRPTHLAVLGAAVASTAKLVAPAEVDMRTPVAARWRDALQNHLATRIEKTLAQCGDPDPEQRPSARDAALAIPGAIEAARAHVLQVDGGAVAFIVVNDPKVTFECNGLPWDVATLIDAKGEVLYETSSNNGVELQWRTDLDGDGVDEALLDVKSMEDGGHEIVLLHRTDDRWDDAKLWSAPSP